MQDYQAHVSALDEGALVRALSHQGTLVVSGEERHSWLAGMLTADFGATKVGDGLYSLSVNKNGRIQAEVWVIVGEEQILMGVRDERVEPLREHMEGYLIMEDAEIEPSEQPYAWWLAHGPRAAEVAEVARREGAQVGMGQLGELSTAVIAMPQPAPGLTEALGSVSGVVLATPEGWDQVRIERMLPSFGVDFDVGNYPQEACLENLAVSFKKGCYIGQEAVFMLEKRGHVSKRLVRLVADGPLAPEDVVSSTDGAGVGKVTSAVSLGERSYALAMVRYKHTVSGTQLKVGELPAQVSCLSTREST